MEELKKKIAELEDRRKNEKEFHEREKKKAKQELTDAQNYLERMKNRFHEVREKLSALR